MQPPGSDSIVAGPQVSAHALPDRHLTVNRRRPNVVVVPLGLFDQLKTVPCIKAIRFAPPQRANPDGHPLRICIGEHGCKNGGAESLALMRGMNIEVVKEKMVTLMAHHHEADPMPLDDQMPGGRRREVGEKAVSRTLRVEAAYPLEAWAHRKDTERGKVFGVLR
jgi:hypothetical protein